MTSGKIWHHADIRPRYKSGWCCANAFGSSAKQTKTVRTELDMTDIGTVAMPNPIIKPNIASKYSLTLSKNRKWDANPNAANIKPMVTIHHYKGPKSYQHTSGHLPTVIDAMVRAFEIKSSAMMPSHPRCLNNEITAFDA